MPLIFFRKDILRRFLSDEEMEGLEEEYEIHSKRKYLKLTNKERELISEGKLSVSEVLAVRE